MPTLILLKFTFKTPVFLPQILKLKNTADVENQVQIAIQEGLIERADENARQLLWSRISNRGLNNNFNIEIITFDEDCQPITSSQQNLLH